jgi:hypothetical protein
MNSTKGMYNATQRTIQMSAYSKKTANPNNGAIPSRKTGNGEGTTARQTKSNTIK